VWGTGVNSSGQLGFFRRKDPEGREVGGRLDTLLEAGHMPLPLEPGERVLRLAAGRAHSLVCTSAGRVLALGDNAHGQCGRPVVEGEDYGARRPVFAMDTGGEEVAGVVAGQDHSLLLTRQGRVLACGWGADGQTGQGHYRSSGQAAAVGGDLVGQEVVRVACAADCVLALTKEGEVFGWGNSEYGQFGLVTEEQQLASPVHLPLGLGEPVVEVASGGSQCLVLTQSGRIYTWGFGILGLGPGVSTASRPVEVPPVLLGRNAFSPDSRVVGIAAGLGHQVGRPGD
jgi:alpha-tubulin suppressor-like RCC1 family protein